MAALYVIGYKPVRSALHDLDPRTKQIMVMVLSCACFVGGMYFLFLTSLCILYCFAESKLRLAQIFREIRYFLFFLIFIFAVRVFTLNDNFIPVVSGTQIESAAIFCWRLLLIVLMGVLLISTTRTTDIRAALVWGLRPLPLINERTTATMVGLIVRMVPLLLYQAGEINDAMRSRCIDARRKPLYRMKQSTILLFRRAFIRADELVDTMQARCYNEHRTLRTLRFTHKDSLAAAVAMVLLTTLFLN